MLQSRQRETRTFWVTFRMFSRLYRHDRGGGGGEFGSLSRRFKVFDSYVLLTELPDVCSTLWKQREVPMLGRPNPKWYGIPKVGPASTKTCLISSVFLSREVGPCSFFPRRTKNHLQWQDRCSRVTDIAPPPRWCRFLSRWTSSRGVRL